MKFQNQVLSLHSDALPSDTLMVAKLHGEERMSGLFRFDLDIICEDAELDLEAVLYAPAKLGISVSVMMAGGKTGSATREIAGVFEEFEQLEKGQGWVKYHAVLVPKLWQATRSHRSRIFMDKTIEGLVRGVLGKQELANDPAPDAPPTLDPSLDFEFQLSRAGEEDPKTRSIYPEREYVVQYEESDWHFLARWLEHEGVFFYFINEEGDEKVVFGDSELAYAKSAFGDTYPYRPEATGDGGESDKFTEEEVRTIRCRQRRLPQTVTVNDYDWRTPSAKLNYSENVRDDGTGLQTEYNDHFKGEGQGKALALVRKEELACRAKVFHGTGSCRGFRPGTTFTLDGHYRDDFNRSYLLLAVVHDAEQMISLESASVTGVKYENTFEAITDDQPWRPERTTDWPSIKGVMHAKVDSEGAGRYAELDEHGRYKLVMPFDEHSTTAKPGKASRWVRMAQPYSGANAGMHFPLTKGTEVLLTHIDGDPDRPIISSAVPNPETVSPSSGSNHTQNAIQTHSGNVVQMDDNANSSGFVIMDAARGTVSDSRHRRTLPNGGSANAQAATDAAQDQAIDDVESRLDALENPPPATLEDAWGAFFDGTAFNEAATDGNLANVTGNAASLTAPESGPSFSSQGLSEATVVTALNYVLGKHVPMSGAAGATLDSGATSSRSAVTGKLADLLANKGQNFLGSAKGTRVKVFTDDNVTFSIGDSYKYSDGSTSINVGTGGYTRNETLAGSTTESEEWGNHESTSTTHGDYTSTGTTHGNSDSTSTTHGDSTSHSTTYGNSTSESWCYGDTSSQSYTFNCSDSFSLVISARTDNSIQIGAFNSNSVFIGLKGGFELTVAGVLETKISAAAVFKAEIGISKTYVDIGKDLRISLPVKDELDIKKTRAALAYQMICIQDLGMRVSKDEAAISDVKAHVSANRNALNTTMIGLNNAKQVLANSDLAMSESQTTAIATRTSALHSIA